MKHKTDKNHFVMFIFFEPAIMVSRYMTCALFKTIKNLVSKKPSVLKTSEFFKKKPEF